MPVESWRLEPTIVRLSRIKFGKPLELVWRVFKSAILSMPPVTLIPESTQAVDGGNEANCDLVAITVIWCPLLHDWKDLFIARES